MTGGDLLQRLHALNVVLAGEQQRLHQVEREL